MTEQIRRDTSVRKKRRELPHTSVEAPFSFLFRVIGQNALVKTAVYPDK